MGHPATVTVGVLHVLKLEALGSIPGGCPVLFSISNLLLFVYRIG